MSLSHHLCRDRRVHCSQCRGSEEGQRDARRARLLRWSCATGFIITSQKSLKCVFTSANKKVAPETYVGVIKKFGLDIGVVPPF